MRIQNNGLGIQSTAILLLSHEGKIPPLDYSIFADTQEEPDAVYQHLEWLKRLPPPMPTILTGTKGKLGDHLMIGQNSTGGRFASIPCFTAKHHTLRQLRDSCNKGIVRRHCTKEYKVEVVERIIRREILNMKPRQHIPKGTRITQIFGFSADERGRAKRTVANLESSKWSMPEFPLIEMGWTRSDCIKYLEKVVPHEVPRSACVFCPFKRSSEWKRTKANPMEWARAVQIDNALREPGNVVNRGMDLAMYLHRSCVPLELVDFDECERNEKKKFDGPNLFSLLECEGMCGV